MNQAPTAPQFDLAQETEKVASLITAARRLLREDRMIDLTALQGKVGALCEAIQAAPIESVQGLKPPIEAILKGLDNLEAELTAQNADVTAESDDVRRQALAAYTQTKDDS